MKAVKNKHHVAKHQWAKFHIVGQHVFNRVFEELSHSKDFNHVNSWNAAWSAATNARDVHEELMRIEKEPAR